MSNITDIGYIEDISMDISDIFIPGHISNLVHEFFFKDPSYMDPTSLNEEGESKKSEN